MSSEFESFFMQDMFVMNEKDGQHLRLHDAV